MTQAARIYGGSLYDLAAEENLTDIIWEQVSEVRKLFYENPDYVRLLSEPSIPVSERKECLSKALGEECERYLVNFLKLLCDRNLLREFGGCCDEYKRRYYLDKGISEAVVTCAVPLTDAQQKALTEELSAMSGKKVFLTIKTDPSVLAGLRVEIDGKQLDGTLQGRLSGISRKLSETTL